MASKAKIFKEEWVGEQIRLDLVGDMADKETWNVIYQHFMKLMELKLNAIDSRIVQSEYIAQQWESFKQYGLITYRTEDAAKVKAIIGDIKRYVDRKFSILS